MVPKMSRHLLIAVVAGCLVFPRFDLGTVKAAVITTLPHSVTDADDVTTLLAHSDTDADVVPTLPHSPPSSHHNESVIEVIPHKNTKTPSHDGIKEVGEGMKEDASGGLTFVFLKPPSTDMPKMP